MENLMKVCKKCSKVKPLSEYAKKVSSPTGIQSICKECDKERNMIWRFNNPEKEKQKALNYQNKIKAQIKPKITIISQSNLNKNSNQMESSRDYSKFKIAPNKELNLRHVEKLKKEILINDLGAYYPIQCKLAIDGYIDVINGQHRWNARKDLGLDIYYVISEVSLLEERRAEKITLKWSKSDVVHYYYMKGLESYVNLKKLENNTGWKIGSYSQGVMKFKKTTNFENGLIDFSENDYNSMKDKIQYAQELLKYIPFTIPRSLMVCLVGHIFRNESIDRCKLFEKVKKYNQLLMPKINVDGYLEIFEKVYNYNSKSGNTSFKRNSKEIYL